MEIIAPLLKLWPQWLAALIVTLLSISLGMVVGWSSPYLAQLIRENSSLPITREQASWVVSLVPLGRLAGATTGSISIEYLGSKTSLLLTGLPAIIGWICITCANSATWLYVSRLFSGISTGMFFSCFPLYIGEISAASIRGALVGLVINGIPLGILIGNIMGPNMSMMWFGIISLVLILCYMTIFPFVPHSPHYFVQRNDSNGASKAIQWYNRRSDVRSELTSIEKFIQSSNNTTIRGRLKRMKEPKNKRAFIIVILLYIFMQLSGLNTIVFYMEIITTEAKVTSISPSLVVIIVNTSGIIIGWCGTYAIDRCGRRILLAVSSSGVIVGMAMLGLHFMLLDQNFSPENLQWLPILALIIFMLMCIGLVPVPSTMLSELFPADLKSIAGFVGSVTSAAFAFLASKTYQPLVDVMSEKYVFWTYGMIMIVSLIYSLLGVPETMGKTLEEIQAMLAQGNNDEEQEPGTNNENEENQ